MSALKGAVVMLGVVALLAGLLLGTGIIELRGPSGEGDDAAATPSEGGNEDDDASRRKDRGKDRGKDGKRRDRDKDDDIPDDLESLGYISSVPIKKEDRGKRGVVYGKDKVGDGLFLVNPTYGAHFHVRGGPVHEVQLWTTKGDVVHTWKPDPSAFDNQGFAIARMDVEGFIYVVAADFGVFKYDYSAEEMWRISGFYHHDLNFDLDGGLLLVTEERRQVPPPPPEDGEDPPAKGETVRILDHGITFAGTDGKVSGKIMLYDSFADDPIFQRTLNRFVRRKERRRGEGAAETHGIDVFHLNAVQVLPHDIDGLGAKGDLLVSPRHLDTIAVIDRKTGELKWQWGHGELQQQHDPTLTKDDKIVVFDNGNRRGWSRVLIIDPKTKTIVREFNGGSNESFYSAGRGLAQSLDDGNLFVVVSNEARILEVAPDDQILWEFFGPWERQDQRFPIRAVRLQGPVLATARAILDGEKPKPLRPATP